MLKASCIYMVLIAVIMLVLSGLVASWYGLSAGLLVAVWPIYYFGMIAKELDCKRKSDEVIYKVYKEESS
jgi:uncharacterized membrane protein YkgB